MVEASPRHAGTAYVAANRYQQDDFGVYIYRTDDFGQSWTRITGGIKGDDFARVVREDPARPGLLYAGTEHGFYVSFDNGALWHPFSLDLPDTQVPDIVVRNGDIVIATHGRSAYVLDGGADLLRQVTPPLAAAAVNLFRPSVAIRSVDRTATIRYWLRKPATNLRLEILDAQGAVVRSFTKAPAHPDTAHKEADEEGEEGRPRLPAFLPDSAGLDHFGWDLRYAGPDTFPKMVLWAARPAGPKALPGAYRVRLTANGVTQTEPLEVRADPRLHDVTLADLQAEYRLATRIRDRFSQANDAVLRIRALRGALEDREKKTDDAGVHRLADALNGQISAIESRIYQTKSVADEDALNFPIMLNNKIGALQGIVESADARPTTQDYTIFTQLSAQLQAQLDALQHSIDGALPPLNAALRARNLPPIEKPGAAPRPPAVTAVEP